jgi:hypothetical protein
MQSASFAGEVVLVLNQEQRRSLRIDSHILFPLGSYFARAMLCSLHRSNKSCNKE